MGTEVLRYTAGLGYMEVGWDSHVLADIQILGR
jgi:hypothetical protein